MPDVQAARELPAYHAIQAGDLVTVTRPLQINPSGLFTDTARLIGRYALEEIEPGTALRRGQVSQAPAAGRRGGSWVVTAIPVAANTLPLAQPGQAARLLAGQPGPNGAPGAATLADVLVLAGRQDGEQAWIIAALPAADLLKLVPYAREGVILLVR